MKTMKQSDVVQAVNDLAAQVGKVGSAITADAIQGQDATGGGIASLTEAVMGITAGLVDVAGAIRELAQAVSGK